MSEQDSAAPNAAEAATPVQTKRFRRPFSQVRMDPSVAERQGRIARIAFETLGSEQAKVFLNTEDAALGGRPLDLAMADEDGLAKVQAALMARAKV